MSNKLTANETLNGGSLTTVTASHDSNTNKSGLDVNVIGGTTLDVRAKFVEATYTDSDLTVTYNYYESVFKVTLYNTIITRYTIAQDTTFRSASWS